MKINPYPMLIITGVLMCATVIFLQTPIFDSMTAPRRNSADLAAKTPPVAQVHRSNANGLASNIRMAAADHDGPLDQRVILVSTPRDQ